MRGRGKRRLVMKRLFLLILSTSLIAKSNLLLKGYHHEGPTNDQIVLYFASKPDCTVIPQKEVVDDDQIIPVREDGLAQLDFFIPSAHITKKMSKFITTLNALDNGRYRCFIQEDNNKKGIKLSILFRPDSVGFQQEQFEAITGHQALAFTFFNRSVLKQINSVSRPLLRTAQVKKKLVLF